MKIFLILDLIVLNSLVGYLVYKSQAQNPNDGSLREQTITNIQTPIDYSESIQALNKRVGDLELTPYPSPAGASGQAKTVTVIAPSKTLVKNTSYVGIPGSGESSSIDWKDIAGTDFYFDKSEFAGLLNVTFEGNIKLFNGNGIGSVRLLDVTHGIAVVGSEINTSKQIDTIVDSGLLTIWSGRNLYRIQGKSNSSDRLIFNWGKLKITTQN